MKLENLIGFKLDKERIRRDDNLCRYYITSGLYPFTDYSLRRGIYDASFIKYDSFNRFYCGFILNSKVTTIKSISEYVKCWFKLNYMESL